MKFTLFLAVVLCLHLSIFGQGSKSHVVNFEKNSHQLIGPEKEKLKDFFALFDKSKITEIKLLGHTDSDGEDHFNDVLSQNRTKAVKRNLLVHGLVSMNEESFGEKKPLNFNGTDAEKARNRRVVVIVRYAKGGFLASNDFKALAYRNLPTSEYCIDPERDTTLQLKGGGRVVFKANTFASDGKCVTIKSKEAYKKSDIVLANLSTMSNGALLESGGMMYLEARNSSGDELQSNIPFEVQMPTSDFKEGMMIFNGDHAPDSSLNWNQDREIDASKLLNQKKLGDCFVQMGKWNIIDSVQKIKETRSYELDCEECKFFSCRVKRVGLVFKGTGNAEQKVANKEFRNCQKKLKAQKRKMSFKVDVGEDTSVSLVREYKDTLILNEYCAALKAKLDSLGISTIGEYQEYLHKKRLKETEDRLRAGKVTTDQMTFYSMQSSRMRWINCDRFIAMPDKDKIDVVVPIADEEEADETALKNAQVNIILSDKASMIRSNKEGKKFSFINLPAGMSIFVLAVLVKKGKIFMSLEKTSTKVRMDKLDFKEVSFGEFREALKILD